MKEQERKKTSLSLRIICQKEQRPGKTSCAESCNKRSEASAYQNDSIVDEIDQEELQNLKQVILIDVKIIRRFFWKFLHFVKSLLKSQSI